MAKDPKDEKFEWLSVDVLIVDRTYQRIAINWGRVRKMAAEWDSSRAGTIEVNHRPDDGLYAIMDGGTRFEAAKIAGVRYLHAHIHEGKSLSEEARTFVDLNVDRTGLPALEVFNGLVKAGDADALRLVAVVEAEGFSIPRRKSGGNASFDAIAAIGALQSIYRTGGEDILRDTLRIVRTCWEWDKRARSAPILSGVAGVLYFYKNHPNFDKATLIDRMTRQPLNRLVQRGKELGQMGTSPTSIQWPGYRRAIVEMYNYRTKTRHLPETLSRPWKGDQS